MVIGDKKTFDRSIGGEDTNSFLSGGPEHDEVRREILEHIRNAVLDAKVDGVVVGMSGGVDSTVTATLAVEALGSERVLGIGLPCTKTDSVHARDARTIADGLGIEFQEVQLRPLMGMFEDLVAPKVEPSGDRLAIGNALSRLRMLCLYYAANTGNLLVVGTANRSELLLGYFTKYGDGAADLYPLGDLYKTEVRSLASHIGVPRRIISKPATGGLWAGQTDEAELGSSYSVIDRLLREMVDNGKSVGDAADDVDVSVDLAQHVAAMYLDSFHKRTLPPMPGIGEQTDDRTRAPFQR